ncbi:MAG: glycosyltransferase [Pseudomonadota bacterium]
MIRILHVINSFGRGGSETQLLQLLKDYDRTHFHIDVCTIGSEPGPLAYVARDMGAEVLSCPKSANLISFSRRLTRKLQGTRYDIVHAHFDAWSGPIVRAAAHAGVPVRIAHVRSSGAQGMAAATSFPARIGRAVVNHWGRQWIKQSATHVFGVSKAALDARWPGWQANPQRFMVWTAGVDTQYFSPAEDQLKTDASPQIVCVGNFFLRSKRQDLALQILSLVRKSVPSARLVLVGHGTYEKDCLELAKELGVAEAVDFVGLCNRSEVLKLLRTAAVFLSCSESEGLSNALLEAQAVGVPVVASDIPANREALAPDLHDYMFAQASLEDAASSIVRILSDPELRSKLGRAGRQYVQDHFDSRHCLARLEQCYRNLAGQAPKSFI